MPETVYFHIGSMKAGSTALQKFCYLNRDALLDAGVDYVQFQRAQLELPRWANGFFLLQNDFDAEFVRKKLEESSAKSILISEEGMMSKARIWQNPVFRKMRRVIILYLRNSVELVASWASENSLPYNFRQREHSSGRGVVSVDEGLHTWATAYRGMLFAAYQAFKADPELEVIVRPFPPNNPKKENLVQGFLKLLEIPDSATVALACEGGNELINEGKTRKYCDASYLLSELVQQYDVPRIFNTRFVDAIVKKLKSGDDRKIIETLTRLEIVVIQNRLLAPIRLLQSDYGAPQGIDSLPELDAGRAPYRPIDLRELTQLFCERL